MEKILVVAYHYPPEEGSCSDKNVKIVNKLLESGYKVTVITKNKGFKDNNIQKHLEIIRLNNGFMHKKWQYEKKTNYDTKSFSKANKIKTFLSANLIPDATIDWNYELKKWVKKNTNLVDNFDLIFSISSPYSAHLGSFGLAKKLNKPLILCYGDPWIYEPKRKRGFLRYAIEKRMEGRILNYSSKVLLITQWNKRNYSEIYNIIPNNIHTYNIGYDPTKNKILKKQPKQTKLNLIYGGSLDEVHRNPEPFLKALINTENLLTNIYNNDSANLRNLVENYQLETKVILNPLIPSNEFENRLYDMDVLLLFGNKTPFQVPGKLFTYMATGMHILYIKNNNYDDDGTQKILEDYNNATIVQNDVTSISNGLKEILSLYKNNRLGEECNRNNYEYKITMEPIIDAIKETLN